MTYRKFSKRQLLAMTWWNQPDLCDRDAVICDGAVRSGKTLAMCCGFFLWSMARFDRGVFALCGKTVSALRRNVVLHLQHWLGAPFVVTEHRQENKLTVRLGSRVNTYYLFGGQDEGSYMLIQGMTLGGVLLDETVLMPRSFVEQAVARCSEPGSKLWFSCNPGSREHWFYREWICQTHRKNALYLHFTMQDNPGLTEAVRQRYHRLYTGLFYRRYVLGQWCRAEGLVYAFDKNRHISTDFDPQPQKNTHTADGRQISTKDASGRQLSPTEADSRQISTKTADSRHRQTYFDEKWYISVDYGTQNPFSAGLWCVRDGVAVRVREFYHSGRDTGRQMTDEEYHQALETLAGDAPVQYVIIDPSAASMIALLRKQGKFRVRRARNAVLPGIRLVSSLLEQGRLLFSPACVHSIREFSLYCWEDDPARDAPKKENDHAMDDIRYFCMSVMARQGGYSDCPGGQSLQGGG